LEVRIAFFSNLGYFGDSGEKLASSSPYNQKGMVPPAFQGFSAMKKANPMTGRRTRSVLVAVVMGAALSMSAEKCQAAQPSEQSVSDVSRYCQVCWRNARLHPDTWPDATQEVLTRLLQRVEPSRWSTLLKNEGDDRREFFRAIDAVKKRTQRTRKLSGLNDEVTDYRSQPDSARNELREEVFDAASEILSIRQQRILHLSGDGWSIPEIARELRTSVERISDEKYKAIRKLRKHLNVA
jgi:RNA polymerase sigma factor (sigma-70 family)